MFRPFNKYKCENNICLIRQEKHVNFLRYSFEGYAPERLHLRRPETNDKAMLMEQVIQLHQKGRSCRQISDELGIHFTTVGRMIQREKEELAIKDHPGYH
ncbi:MAG: helix-turn-helix domain-containing protein [Bacteroidota bacterium]|nr:helix-turn-helix domain-containing protein [Bacteroidota bacterium]